LNLASATGEAGQMMLARQHRLPLGKGLVGRAAASNSVVLAPNLSRAILPEVVTAANVELALQRAADPTIQTRWYGDYLSRTFVEFNRLATASTQARPLKLGYVLHFWGDFTAEIQRGAEDAARDLGLEIEVVAPPYGDKAEAVNLFEQLVKAGKDGLVVIPELEEPWPGPFERAAQAGIPVVTANSTGPNLAAWPWFGQDGYQSGFTLADEFKKFLLAAGHTGGTIVVGACTTAEVVISARYEGFKKGLENSGFTLTPLYETGLDPAVNRQSWAELVPAWPDLVAAVGLSAPDIPSLARIKKQTNAPWLIAGYDLVVETLETIEAGLVQVAIGQHPYLQGYLPVLALAQHLRQGQPLQNWMVEGWLPNPLLPETKAEVAVPITLEGRVVGVLDVQADKVGALDESDANILRSLANQIAVAVRNARLFEEVQTALAEARELQQRYVEQAWDKTRLARHNVRRAQFSLGESTALSEATIAQARQQALSHPQPVVVPLNGGGSPNSADTFNVQPSTLQTLVSPISLRGVPIGSLQLYESSPERQWTEPELDLINAVIDQVAQAAENLRLLDESQERASREQLISYISNKMRRATDLENLMEVTVTELARVLEPARTFVHLNLNE
jgi:simple sugar transport system substrate-binding protein